MSEAKTYVLSVMARDRVGIVAGVTDAIFRLSGNVAAMSQTVLKGYFTIIVKASFPAGVEAETARAAVEASGERGELAVSIMGYDPAADGDSPGEAFDQFVLSIMGQDQPGVIARISSYLASRQINIEDLYAYAREDQFTLLSQVMIPRRLDLGQLQIDLEGLYKNSDMVINLQHEDIFLATNRVDFRLGVI